MFEQDSYNLWTLAASAAFIVIATTFTFTTVTYVVQRRWRTRRRNPSGLIIQFLVIALPLGLVGATTGYLVGLSRVPAVTALLPALLSFSSAVFLLAFSLRSPRKVPIIGSAIIVFSLCVFSGILIGAGNREQGRVARLKMLSEQELRIRTYRENRNLPADFPIWALTGEGIFK